MSKHDKWMLFLGIVTVGLALAAAVGTWWGVIQSKDYRGGVVKLLVLPLAFIAIAILNAYSIYRNVKDVSKRKAQRLETQFVGGEAALLNFFQARADEMVRRLEELWHHYNAAGETLIYPAGGEQKYKNLSSDAAGKLINERRDFMVLYTHHLHWLSLEIPKFQSATTINGYPSDKEYPEVLRNLKDHVALLEKLGDEAWYSGNSVFH
jgi:hypothetical protein